MTWPQFSGASTVCWRWRAWIRPLVVCVYIVLLIVALPLCIWELNRKGAPQHVQAWFIGGVFVMFAVPISLWSIVQHLVHYTQPPLQRCIVRILWMVPIFALNAWLGLRFPDAAIYLDTLRECYEAYVIYNFMSYLLHYLNSEHMDLDLVLENKRPVKHLIPFCCLPTWRRGQSYIQRCKHGVLQYTVLRPTMTIIALICEFSHVYGEGDFNFQTAWSYLVIINNASQIVAMYCLIMFYRATKEELRPINPVPKFLCIKAVVFLTFWQSMLISILIKAGVISEKQTWEFYNVKSIAAGLQDFLICIEMFLAAIAHYFSFSHTPYMDSAAQQRDCWSSFLSMWDITDVKLDVAEHLNYVGSKVKRTVSRGRPLERSLSSEQTPLLPQGTSNNLSGDDDHDSDNDQSSKYAIGTNAHTPPIHITTVDLHSHPLDQKRNISKIGHETGPDTDTDSQVYESSMEHNLVDVPMRGRQNKSFTMSMSNYYEGSVSSADSGYIQHSNTWTAVNNGSVEPVAPPGAAASTDDKNNVGDEKSNTEAYVNENSVISVTPSDRRPEYLQTDSDPSSNILPPLENVSEQLNDLMLMDSSYTSASASTYPMLSEYESDFMFSANTMSNSGTLAPDDGDNAPMLFHHSHNQSDNDDDDDDDDGCFQSLADGVNKNSDNANR